MRSVEESRSECRAVGVSLCWNDFVRVHGKQIDLAERQQHKRLWPSVEIPREPVRSFVFLAVDMDRVG